MGISQLRVLSTMSEWKVRVTAAICSANGAPSVSGSRRRRKGYRLPIQSFGAGSFWQNVVARGLFSSSNPSWRKRHSAVPLISSGACTSCISCLSLAESSVLAALAMGLCGRAQALHVVSRRRPHDPHCRIGMQYYYEILTGLIQIYSPTNPVQKDRP